MGRDLHQRKCESCGNWIPLVRRGVIFRPVPRYLRCPNCKQETATTYGYRVMTLFYWSMRTYLLWFMLLVMLGDYLSKYWDKYRLSRFPGYFIQRGPFFIVALTVVCILSSATIQLFVDKVVDRERR